MRTLPQVVRDPSLPERVTIYEVGPRDGLQNEQVTVPTAAKAEFVRRLLAAGLPVVEATSFVHPRWVPQLADAEDLVDELVDQLGDQARDLPVLVPNERGLDRALDKGVRHIAIFGSATETFARRNLNRSLDEQFAMFAPRSTGPAPRASTSGPTCRCASATRGRVRSRWIRSSTSAGGCSTSARHSCPSVTPSASAPPATSPRCSRPSTPPGCPTRRWRCTSTTRTVRPCRTPPRPCAAG